MKSPLQVIPWIGVKMAAKFEAIGVRQPDDLRGKDPVDLYLKMCGQYGRPLDRCVLYVIRCAVYFVETENPDPEKLQWWFWKD